MIAGNVNDIESMRHLIEECGLRASDDYVVKQNWLFQGNGIYTDTGALQPVLKCLDNLTVIKSYINGTIGHEPSLPRTGKLSSTR